MKKAIFLFLCTFSLNGFSWQNYASTLPLRAKEGEYYSFRCQGYTSPDIPYMGINDTLMSVTGGTPPWTNSTSCVLNNINNRLFITSHASNTSVPRVIYSDNKGLSWKVSTMTGSTSLVRGVIYVMNSGKYILEGVNGFYSSVDNGANWSFTTNSAINGGHIVKMKNSNTLVLTRGIQLKYSTDEGVTWTNTLTLSSATQKSGSFFIGNRLFALPYYTGNLVHYTDDGITWVGLGTVSMVNSTGSYVSKTINGVVYLIRGGQYYKSSDGISWTSLHSGYQSVNYENLCGDYYYSLTSSTYSVRSVTTGALINSFSGNGSYSIATCIDEDTLVYR